LSQSNFNEAKVPNVKAVLRHFSSSESLMPFVAVEWKDSL